MHIYIYISYRWDLAATSLAYIWYFDATSVKKTHSHSPPLSRTGDCESSLFALLFIHSLFWHMHWLARRKTNDKTQLSASFPWGMKRLNSLHPSLGAWKNQKKPKKNKKKQNKKTQKKPRSSNYEPPNLSLESLFFVFFVFFGFQLWSLILCREFCSWGLPVGDAMLKWQVQPYFFFWMGRFMEKSGKRRLPKT